MMLVVAPTAGATNILWDNYADGSVGFDDDAGVPNDITVSEPFQSGKIRIHDDLSYAPPFTAKSPCVAVDAVTGECPLDGRDRVVVLPSAGDDTVKIDSSINSPATVLAGYGDDTVYGASGNDILSGNWGNDVVNGGYGDDLLTDSAKFFLLFFVPPQVDGWGGGDDKLYGGPGDDTLDGGELPEGTGAGADVLDGGSGKDTADYSHRTGPLSISQDGVANDGESGEGDNVLGDIEELRGGAGADTLSGSGGADVLSGLGGDDALSGLGGDDTLRGVDGNDTIDGGSGDDTIYGGNGDDVVSGGTGNDKIRCGSGDDTVHAGPGDVVAADCEHVDGLPAAGDSGSGTPPPSGDPGSGTPPPALHGPRVTVGPKTVRFDRRGRAKLLVGCPAGTPGDCSGRVVLVRGGTLVSARFKVAAGKRSRVRVHLTKRGRRALKPSRRLRVKVSARAHDSRGAAATARGKLTLLRSR
jgi:hypothetical protein